MLCPECGIRLPAHIRKCHFCGAEITNFVDNSKFIDKFVALFTLLALFVALIVFFNGYVEGTGKELVPNAMVRAVIAIVIAALLTFFYWLISPLMIRTLIDSLRPFNGNIRRMFLLFGTYFVLVGVNFLFIPTGISLATFAILTIVVFGIYQFGSQ